MTARWHRVPSGTPGLTAGGYRFGDAGRVAVVCKEYVGGRGRWVYGLADYLRSPERIENYEPEGWPEDTIVQAKASALYLLDEEAESRTRGTS